MFHSQILKETFPRIFQPQKEKDSKVKSIGSLYWLSNLVSAPTLNGLIICPPHPVLLLRISYFCFSILTKTGEKHKICWYLECKPD